LQLPHEKSMVSNQVTLSLGVSCIIPSDFTTPEELLNHADKALYQAKGEGRDRAVAR
jgi:diguanylate cyclase (GGDEF)-like protein